MCRRVIGQEVERKKAEVRSDVADTLAQPDNTNDVVPDANAKGPGRPEMDDTERNSDKGNSLTGKQPKPSAPDGSL